MPESFLIKLEAQGGKPLVFQSFVEVLHGNISLKWVKKLSLKLTQIPCGKASSVESILSKVFGSSKSKTVVTSQGYDIR